MMDGLHSRAVVGVDTVLVFARQVLVEDVVQGGIGDLGEEVLEAGIDGPVGRVGSDAGKAEEDDEGEKEENLAAGRHAERSGTGTRRGERGGGRSSSGRWLFVDIMWAVVGRARVDLRESHDVAAEQ